jgi:hypothetical protein
VRTNPFPLSIIRYWLAILLPASAFAQLGKTADECTKFFGRPLAAAMTAELTPPARTLYQYRWHGFDVRAQFVGRDVKDSRCALASYSKIHLPNGPIEAMTDAEIESLLALNANGSRWEAVPWNRASWERAWKRSDNRVLAVESKYTHNGVPDNGLTIVTTDFYPKDSKAFAEIRALLSKPSTK